jgi:hypothetical protein
MSKVLSALHSQTSQVQERPGISLIAFWYGVSLWSGMHIAELLFVSPLKLDIACTAV